MSTTEQLPSTNILSPPPLNIHIVDSWENSYRLSPFSLPVCRIATKAKLLYKEKDEKEHFFLKFLECWDAAPYICRQIKSRRKYFVCFQWGRSVPFVYQWGWKSSCILKVRTNTHTHRKQACTLCVCVICSLWKHKHRGNVRTFYLSSFLHVDIKQFLLPAS